MKLTLRFLTIICYFAPFTFFVATCNGPVDVRFAYNQKEAATNTSNELRLTEVATFPVDTMQYESPADSFMVPVDISNEQNTASDTERNSNDYLEQLFRKMMMPVEKSLSGIGVVFYFKNFTGKIVIAISLLISLAIPIFSRFIKSGIKKYLLLSSILCIVIFMADCFVADVTLRYGVLCLLLLLLLQFGLEYRAKEEGNLIV